MSENFTFPKIDAITPKTMKHLKTIPKQPKTIPKQFKTKPVQKSKAVQIYTESLISNKSLRK